MAENSFYFDGSLCIACRSCQVACKQWNCLPGEKTEFFAAAGGYQNPSDLSPDTWTIIKFHEQRNKGDYNVDWLFRRQHCFHCTDAACIEACPVEPKAMVRHPRFGTVYVNQETCIGCGACEEACPFGVPHVDHEIEKSRKCAGCFDRVANDMLPACAKTCPTGSIRYGEKTALYERAQERVKQLKKEGHRNASVYGLEQLGGLHSIYVLLEKPDFYGLPENPSYGSLEPIQRKAKETYAAWQRDHGEYNLASAPGGLLVMAGLAAAGLKKLADRKNENARDDSKGNS